MSGGGTSPDVDVLVVGGGPIGLAVAIEACLAGLRALVVEPRAAPIDKACGEGLMPGAVTALANLGVHPTGHALSGITYIAGDRIADHAFESGEGLGVRRTSLHRALTLRAEELGVEFALGRADGVVQDADSVTAAGIRASWLMACDGLHSAVRRATGLERPARTGSRRRYGIRRHFALEPWSDRVEVHWGQRAEAYVTPVADGVVGVALLGPPHRDYEASLDAFPDLRARLRGAECLGPPLGAGPMLQRATARTVGRVRLVGDAAGYVDALTGEGIRVGLAQAAAAIRTLEPDVERSGASYERAWALATRDYRLITASLLAVARSPLRRGIVPVSAAIPGLYGNVVERLAR